MSGAAPTESLQFTHQHDQDLVNGVVAGLTKVGHPTTAAEVNPDDQSALKRIEGVVAGITQEPVQAAGRALETGEGLTSRVYTVGGKEPISIARQREIKGRLWK